MHYRNSQNPIFSMTPPRVFPPDFIYYCFIFCFLKVHLFVSIGQNWWRVDKNEDEVQFVLCFLTIIP